LAQKPQARPIRTLGQKRFIIPQPCAFITRAQATPFHQIRRNAAERSLGFVVLLNASEETLYERISRNTKRPLLQTENPRATLSKLLAERSEAYASAADFTLDTTNLSHNAAAESLEAAARTAFAWTRKA
jgi:shikimate kinase